MTPDPPQGIRICPNWNFLSKKQIFSQRKECRCECNDARPPQGIKTGTFIVAGLKSCLRISPDLRIKYIKFLLLVDFLMHCNLKQIYCQIIKNANGMSPPFKSTLLCTFSFISQQWHICPPAFSYQHQDDIFLWICTWKYDKVHLKCTFHNIIFGAWQESRIFFMRFSHLYLTLICKLIQTESYLFFCWKLTLRAIPVHVLKYAKCFSLLFETGQCWTRSVIFKRHEPSHLFTSSSFKISVSLTIFI